MKFVIRGAVLIGIGYGVGYVQGMKAGVQTGHVLEELGRGMRELAQTLVVEFKENTETGVEGENGKEDNIVKIDYGAIAGRTSSETQQGE